MTYTVHEADVLEALRAMPSDHFHGALSDPPYGLTTDGGKTGFMGHTWDKGVPPAEVWREVLRVLKPGAYLLAFGGTRTFHRLTCAIEDAGFEVRDCLMWLHGQGWPKSKGHLKPAWEPVILARKEPIGSVAANVNGTGCGLLNVDGCRVATDWGDRSEAWKRSGHSAKPNAEKIAAPPGVGITCHSLGRWPANVIFDREAGAILDAQSGDLHGAGSAQGPQERWAKARKNRVFSDNVGAGPCGARFGDSGGASRFFKSCDYTEDDARFMYCAKASRKERDAGLEEFDLTRSQKLNSGGIAARREAAGLGLGRNTHPTVKPLALTTYLARLILPPVEGARMLNVFCGSGSEMIGGLRAGWSHVEGIDSWDVAVKIARARLAHHEAQTEPANAEQLTLEVGT